MRRRVLRASAVGERRDGGKPGVDQGLRPLHALLSDDLIDRELREIAVTGQ